MHALIENNVITALRNAPAGGAWEDDRRREHLGAERFRLGRDVTGVRRVVVPSTASDPVSLGLLYEPTPITPAPSGTILDGGTL